MKHFNLTYDNQTPMHVVWTEYCYDIESMKDLFFNEWQDFVCNFYGFDKEEFYDMEDLQQEIRSFYERVNGL